MQIQWSVFYNFVDCFVGKVCHCLKGVFSSFFYNAQLEKYSNLKEAECLLCCGCCNVAQQLTAQVNAYCKVTLFQSWLFQTVSISTRAQCTARCGLCCLHWDLALILDVDLAVILVILLYFKDMFFNQTDSTILEHIIMTFSRCYSSWSVINDSNRHLHVALWWNALNGLNGIKRNEENHHFWH